MLKMKLSSVKTRDYENKRLCGLRQNKPKTNPIKPNFKPGALFTQKYKKIERIQSLKKKAKTVKLRNGKLKKKLPDLSSNLFRFYLKHIFRKRED